jgi:hypothetical protein
VTGTQTGEIVENVFDENENSFKWKVSIEIYSVKLGILCQKGIR